MAEIRQTEVNRIVLQTLRAQFPGLAISSETNLRTDLNLNDAAIRILFREVGAALDYPEIISLLPTPIAQIHITQEVQNAFWMALISVGTLVATRVVNVVLPKEKKAKHKEEKPEPAKKVEAQSETPSPDNKKKKAKGTKTAKAKKKPRELA